jgi:hypothetical protein
MESTSLSRDIRSINRQNSISVEIFTMLNYDIDS